MNYFDFVTPQIEPDCIKAFGINVNSKNSQYDEIIEMINYAHLLAVDGLTEFVESLNYDDVCMVIFDSNSSKSDFIENRVGELAKKTLSRFELINMSEQIPY